VAGIPRFAMDKANAIIAGTADLAKPVAVATLGDETPMPGEFAAALHEKGLAYFRSPDRALRAMARATWYGRAVAAAPPRIQPIALPSYPPPPAGALAEYQGKALLAAIGIAVPNGALARNAREAADIARRIGYPVALKAQSGALAHKSDIGGVVLDIADDAALTRAWDGITEKIGKARPEIALDGMLVERMIAPGLELVVGARREGAWGAVLTVGLGGVWIEALHDIRLLPADIDRDGIIEELAKLKGASLLRGHRGAPGADLDAVADCLMRLGALIRGDPRIAEIEINPLAVGTKGAIALDVLMHIEDA
jgi:acetate---CoA ligase (ADP-forming)